MKKDKIKIWIFLISSILIVVLSLFIYIQGKNKEVQISETEIDKYINNLLGGNYQKIEFKNIYPLGVANNEFIYAQEEKYDNNSKKDLRFINSNSKVNKLNLSDLNLKEYNLNMRCPTCFNYIINSDSILYHEFQIGTNLLDIKNEKNVNYTGSSELTYIHLHYNGYIVRSSVYGFSIYNIETKSVKEYTQKSGINPHRIAVNIKNKLFLFGMSERDSLGNEENFVYSIDLDNDYNVLWFKKLDYHTIKRVQINNNQIYYLQESSIEHDNYDFFSELVVMDLEGNILNKLRMSAISDFEFLNNNDVVLSFDERGLMCLSENLDRIKWSHQYSYNQDNHQISNDIYLNSNDNIITMYSTDTKDIFSYDVIDPKNGKTLHNFEMKYVDFISKDVLLYKENYNEKKQTLFIKK